MLEVLIIMSIVYAVMFMPLRGKPFAELSEPQKQKVHTYYVKYMRTRKGQKTPNLTIEEYLPLIQKSGLIYLIVALCAIPVYVLVLLYLYPAVFGF